MTPAQRTAWLRSLDTPVPLRLTAWTTWDRPSCFVCWRGGVWGGRAVPTFVSELRARLSVASEWSRLVEGSLS